MKRKLSPKKKRLRLSSDVLDWTSDCFVCGQCKSKKKCEIYYVKFPSVKETILRLVDNNRDNENSKKLRDRLNVSDLIALGASYHNSCYKNIFYCPMGGKKGRAVGKGTFKQHVCDNADFNWADLCPSNGLGGFHYMGSIEIITPAKISSLEDQYGD